MCCHHRQWRGTIRARISHALLEKMLMAGWLVTALAYLFLSTGFAVGQSPADVKLVHQKLRAYGADKTDGTFGPKTRAAILAYQRDWQLPETGAITDELIKRLKRDHPATRPQWLKLSGQDCEIWNAWPRARHVATWTGACVGGKASGHGKLSWTFQRNGRKAASSFEGEYRDGKAHGTGKLTDSRGNLSEGEWRDGKKNGTGVMVYTGGHRFEGQYRNGKRHGRGIFQWANGDRYEGDYHNGKRHGRGSLRSANGDLYEGDFRNNKFNGKGVYTFKSGGTYNGDFKDGRFHGKGRQTFPDGDSFEGTYWKNYPHGRGTYIVAKGGREIRHWTKGCSRGAPVRSINRTVESCGF